MYLHRLRIRGVRGFNGPRAVDLRFERQTYDDDIPGRYRGFCVIAGRNGSGKTTLLRAAATALAGPEVANSLTEGDRDWVSHGQSVATVNADIVRDGREYFLGSGRTLDSFSAALKWERTEGARARPQHDKRRGRGGRMAETALWSPKPTGWFAAGYGPFRRLAGTSGEVARIMAGDWTAARFATLFREEASLAESVQWLQQVNYRARAGRADHAELERHVIDLLNDGLFPDGHSVDRVDPDGLWVTRASGTPVRIDEMSDGYRTITALATDIVRQIHECYDGGIEWSPDGPAALTSGVVLIDEIDVHLHVSWQKRIGPWLVEHFPNIQFIVTSHSPYICQSASPGGLIQLPGPEDDFPPRFAGEDLFRRVVNGSGDDAVLTELFGLDSPYSERVDRLRATLTRLERLAIRGEAGPEDITALAELSEAISPSPGSRVRDVLGDDV
ncbi:energy-coupling factor transporter ATP-binding protein EcfA2 [Catenuloplanes nepalensis]|uniref:Energy-coupling factor transporter ATP-binding protein EcfA2 n=1 Tax=Catenuloplanes nepalensis TaxID=587533 RepID=A0ABT9MPX6_9ACTN|nr:AAA family ATPase [Catenuloplanes nepalensis]MDP9793453.1 energy-coupling factor transporter ATP-binding protein EcfA2 [Catenuloplanes nepalensis]